MAPEEDQYAQAQQLLDQAREGHKIKILHVTKDRTSTLALLRALRANELLAIQGDRIFGDAWMEVPIFGSPAKLPLGAISLAIAAGAPIIPSVTVRRGRGRYSIVARDPVFLKRTSDDKETNIQNGLALVAKEMEAFLKEYHLQWFNFFNFWN